MSRSSVDLPQPEGPMSDTNSSRSIERSMPSSACVCPAAVSKTFETPAIEAGDWPASVIGSPCARRGPAAQREQLHDPNDPEEGQAEDRGGEHRRPQLLRPAAVLLVEVQDRPAEPELAPARVPLADDRADDARRRRDLQG